VSEYPPGDDVAEQLRCDIHVLRTLLDAAREHSRDERLADVCVSMLRDRRERLELLDADAA